MVTTYDDPTPTLPPTDAGAAVAPRSGMADSQSDMLSRVVQTAHQTVDRLAETAAPQVQRLQEGVASAGELLSSGADKLGELGDEWADGLRSTVREHPLACVAAALAFGVLIARLAR